MKAILTNKKTSKQILEFALVSSMQIGVADIASLLVITDEV
jgi:hypothetical protein